ncbi:MAG: hypothetical protein LBR83_02110 [Clostridiales bacterium]|jgi:glycosidase|nr:hypothetical protein [Clostridiales bacterium]
MPITAESTASALTVTFPGGTTLLFDKNLSLKRISAAGNSLHTKGLFADIGADARYVRGSLRFESFLDFNTWALPQIEPRAADIPREESYRMENEKFIVTGTAGGLQMNTVYYERSGTLAVEVEVTNKRDKTLWINGAAFTLVLDKENGTESFRFPGSPPCGEFFTDKLTPYRAEQSGLVSAVTLLRGGGEANLIFIDPLEKWSTGVYADDGGNLCHVNLAGVECDLKPGESFRCGTLYLQPVSGEHFAPLQRFYKDMGYAPPTDGIRDGVIYSGHPDEMFNTNLYLGLTMRQYAEYLDALAETGIDIIWLLPLFHHTEEGDPGRNVYTPTDHTRIDPRYGTDQDVLDYVNKAKSLGMGVVFDYVPHGPRPHDPQGVEKTGEWASKRRDGSPQLEWTCLSYDMTNPTYLSYMKETVKSHVDRFGVSGARIDCAMGGLSNWRPCPGNRPSCSNMMGGIKMSRAIREAFIEKGLTPFVTPENFHPVPLYASCTDAYYDMALYRVLYDLNHREISRGEYVRLLTAWLDDQQRALPEGLLKMRFLGNHDTVSWVWDKQRATAVYGVERAKAMWALISLIDGFPMIYQGDEDPAWYKDKGGAVLKDFFKKLFAARKAAFDNRYSVHYIFTGTPVFAFTREKGGDVKLVLINLSDADEVYTLPGAAKEIFINEGCVFENGTARLIPNGFAVMSMAV